MSASVLVNGDPAGTIAPLDRGLAYGDGIFRTIRVAGGRALNWSRHYERLRIDARTLALPVPDESLLLGEIRTVAPAEAVVKVVVTRGASGRGYAFEPTASPTRIVAAFPATSYPAAHASVGVEVRRCALVLSHQPRLAGAKTLNRLENVLARNEWSDARIAEGLLADAAGRVIEGTVSNVFLVKAGRLATPDLSLCGVAGAQRSRVQELLANEGIACEVRHVGFEEVAEADEVFLTNSLIGVWPVARYESRLWAVGPVTRRAQALVEADDA